MLKIIVLFASFFICCFSLSAKAEVTKSSDAFKLSKTEIYTIKSDTLNRNYNIYIKVPYDYFDKDKEAKTYPVIYLNDGPYPFKVASAVTHMKKMDKAIIVGLSFANGENGMASRVRDLTPVVDKSWIKYKTGGANEFLKFMETELFPFIEKKYRASKNNRIYAGQSLGGSFGAWVLLTKPQLFKSYILTSPSLWYKDKIIFDLEDNYAAKHKNLNANVFMATGGFETIEYGMNYNMADDMKEFSQQLLSRGYPNLKIHHEVISGAIHENTFPIGFSKGLLWILTDSFNDITKK